MSYPRRFDTSSTTNLLHSAGPSQTFRRESEWGELPSPYPTSTISSLSISNKFSLSADPQAWGSNLSPNVTEADDELHNPAIRGEKVLDDGEFSFLSSRGIANIGCLFLLCAAMLTLFVGYPIITYMREQDESVALNLGVNASGQVPEIGNFGLIDMDTPDDAQYFTSWRDGKKWRLVFSDEFEEEGRTFYPGDDPYWEAIDLHYWATNNMEWYDPAAVTTRNGSLVLTLSAKQTHGLDYEGAHIQTWNKFCFTGGYLVSSVQLPGIDNIVGLWPAVWAMGNLGRAGYGASLDGTWPYTYDSCDVGSAPNQTINGLPAIAQTSGAEDVNYVLSYLPGQRLSRCTCNGESHPGPKHSDGTYVGRAAPEIDVFEAQISDGTGQVSQSGQWAPFNAGYVWDNSSDNMIIADSTISMLNTYIGGKTQQATSVVSETNKECYQLASGCFAIYGFEYKPGYASDNAYISWINDGKLAWTINAAGVGADTATEISARPIPQEPMYIMANLGMSTNFGEVDLDHLTFPAVMLVDYIRVYQDPDNINIGCDPKDFPTADYIATYNEAYQNPNLTTWVDDYGQTIPKSSLLDGC
ncbi:related to KRE6-glucan synthase subunit [Armillaria ostoyae]|uniref:Related to KRE6-glucan synthase subunit n=1 Tax=Armillaria ostoyae TaxID=47428 RepID=A0A284R091_ARMOS|nr:related to KRE6-glucan synthase subunit [Armillaria ostoyae]